MPGLKTLPPGPDSLLQVSSSASFFGWITPPFAEAFKHTAGDNVSLASRERLEILAISMRKLRQILD